MATTLKRWRTRQGADPDIRLLENLLGHTPTFGADRIVTAATTVLDSDQTLLVATAGGAVTVTLPDAGLNLGRRFTIKKMDSSANNLTLATTSSQNIDGATTKVWNTQYTAFTVQAVTLTAPNTNGWVLV